jgi:EthD domain
MSNAAAPLYASRSGLMIKLLTLLARRSDLTHAQFVEIWADETPVLITAAGLCRRYVQYRLHPDRVWPPGTPQLDLQLDGIEEVWLEGPAQQAAEILGNVRTLPYLQHLRNHVGAMVTYVFDELRITNTLPEDATGDGMLKRLVPLVRKQGWSHEQFIQHWVNVHAELLKKLSQGPRRYCQLYVNGEVPRPDGIAALDVYIDGFSESWFVNEAEMNADNATPEGEALSADNRVYLSRSKRFFFDDHVGAEMRRVQADHLV